MYQWQKVVDPAAFAGRDGAGALTFNNKMWLLGGWNPDDKINFPRICNSEIWSSVDGADWALESPDAGWEPRHCGGYVLHDGKMWIVGGDSNQGHHQEDVWNSEDGVHWQLVNAHVPWAPRVAHYTVAFAGKIWVMGGQTIPKHVKGSPEYFYNDVWSTVDGIEWEHVTDRAPWSPRGMIGGSVAWGGRIWLLGGGTYETPLEPVRKLYNEVWSTADGANWQRHADAPWLARQYHEVAVFDEKMWVLEGFHLATLDWSGPDDGNRNDVWFSADGETWHEVPGTLWAPRHAASVFVHDEALWMVAGNNMQPDVWKLTHCSG